jgi:hypothetical protein
MKYFELPWFTFETMLEAAIPQTEPVVGAKPRV